MTVVDSCHEMAFEWGSKHWPAFYTRDMYLSLEAVSQAHCCFEAGHFVTWTDWLTVWPDTPPNYPIMHRKAIVPSRFPIVQGPPTSYMVLRGAHASALHQSLRHTSIPHVWASIDLSVPGLLHAAQFHHCSAIQSKSSQLPHLTPDGEAHMVDVSEKAATSRRAIAVGRVAFESTHTIGLIKSALIKKGDVLGTARLAGIMAAKNCPALIPLCHPIMITGVRVDVRLDDSETPGGVTVESEVKCVGQTGVEMEALTSVTGALLTVIDMVKSVDRGARIENVRLVLKEGGRSGLWKSINRDRAIWT